MLGVCYYPEHWPEDYWSRDAQRMRDLGLTYVRIGEFAWGRMDAIARREALRAEVIPGLVREPAE